MRGVEGGGAPPPFSTPALGLTEKILRSRVQSLEGTTFYFFISNCIGYMHILSSSTCTWIPGQGKRGREGEGEGKLNCDTKV